MRRFLVIVGLLILCHAAVAQRRQQSVNQWPRYQYNSNFSPLTQITPANVAQLTRAWTFNYGAGSLPSGNLGLDYRFEVQPLIIDGVMYISTPGSPRDPNVKSTVTALEPETGRVLWQYTSPRNIHGRALAYWPGTGAIGPRLFFATDKGYLMAVGLKIGELAGGFGNGGEGGVYRDVASEVVGQRRPATFTLPNAPTAY